MHRAIVKPAVLALALVGAGFAFAEGDDRIDADRPGLADGSRVVGQGRLQMEAGIQKEFRRSAGTSEHRVLAPLLLRAGVGRGWEVRLETDSYFVQKSRDAFGAVAREEGAAPVALGAKSRSRAPPMARCPPLD